MKDLATFTKRSKLRENPIGQQVNSVKIREIDGATVDINAVRRRFCAGWLMRKTAHRFSKCLLNLKEILSNSFPLSQPINFSFVILLNFANFAQSLAHR